MRLHRKGVLKICKSRKYGEKGFWKPLLGAKLAENDPQMASKACLKDGKWTPRLAFPFVITFHGLWGTFLGKPGWNEPKTLKPVFSVWPNAPKRGFGYLLLIWNESNMRMVLHWRLQKATKKIINAKNLGGGHGSRTRQAGLQCRYFPRSCMTVTYTTCW